MIMETISLGKYNVNSDGVSKRANYTRKLAVEAFRLKRNGLTVRLERLVKLIREGANY